MDNVTGPLNDPHEMADKPFEDLLKGLLSHITDRLEHLEKAVFQKGDYHHPTFTTTTTKMMTDTYNYIWRRETGGIPPFIEIEVDIRYVYTVAIPPITRGPPDAWVEGENATLTIDSFTIEGTDHDDAALVGAFWKHLEEDRAEIEAEIIESIEANLTDS